MAEGGWQCYSWRRQAWKCQLGLHDRVHAGPQERTEMLTSSESVGQKWRQMLWLGISARSRCLTRFLYKETTGGLWRRLRGRTEMNLRRSSVFACLRSSIMLSAPGKIIKGEFRAVLGLSVFHLKMLMYIKLLIKKSISHHKLFLIWNI